MEDLIAELEGFLEYICIYFVKYLNSPRKLGDLRTLSQNITPPSKFDLGGISDIVRHEYVNICGNAKTLTLCVEQSRSDEAYAAYHILYAGVVRLQKIVDDIPIIKEYIADPRLVDDRVLAAKKDNPIYLAALNEIVKFRDMSIADRIAKIDFGA